MNYRNEINVLRDDLHVLVHCPVSWSSFFIVEQVVAVFNDGVVKRLSMQFDVFVTKFQAENESFML